jgi:hypothetical protein
MSIQNSTTGHAVFYFSRVPSHTSDSEVNFLLFLMPRAHGQFVRQTTANTIPRTLFMDSVPMHYALRYRLHN